MAVNEVRPPHIGPPVVLTTEQAQEIDRKSVV